MSTTKRKAPVKLAAPVSRTSARIPNKAVIDESKTSIAGPDAYGSAQVETIELSSDADSDEDLSDAESLTEEQQKPTEEASNTKLVKQKSNDEAEDEDEDGAAPSFGELLRVENDIIDVPSAINGTIVSHSTRNAVAPPSHQSLATVLSQALRTDDTDLLESCLHTTDLATVHNTIERLDSALAGTLLTKLAARLYRRPGRAGALVAWVNWTLIAHGGALASQPKVLQSLSGLQKVLSERAKGLSSLLALKGKLEMLECQMKLRRRVYSGLNNSGDSDSDDDEDVIWVEGEDEAARTPGRRRGALDGDFDDSDDDVPITNGFVGDSDDEEESAGEEADSDAEESLDEDEVNHEDVDDSMGEDEESDVEAAAAPPSKLQKTASNFSKRR
ncbi:hypothetical protein FPSE_10237 [Fusarium pseudograminearum CS3096]|uniref:Small-subunit processome Utp12 domain-containing protein n=1 Tax=Fusarium pseudograminearum (strain CS3096) TaxID=1028729 RepID=K3V8F8_FUSPC|nr:hypothetical protein FPSE_10237 [Fusarium pseudograminearum CS3096]EKJ69589.1 hypothetical protein FPSE_10237 [Fusarium pseudograminearum CS3096]KAF0645423.1 hypothetical protein FPSE5266_10237 [Fusarium pseudograminearum]